MAGPAERPKLHCLRNSGIGYNSALAVAIVLRLWMHAGLWSPQLPKAQVDGRDSARYTTGAKTSMSVKADILLAKAEEHLRRAEEDLGVGSLSSARQHINSAQCDAVEAGILSAVYRGTAIYLLGGVLLGGVGFLVLGPIGAVAGAAAGAKIGKSVIEMEPSLYNRLEFVKRRIREIK